MLRCNAFQSPTRQAPCVWGGSRQTMLLSGRLTDRASGPTGLGRSLAAITYPHIIRLGALPASDTWGLDSYFRWLAPCPPAH